MSKTSCAPWRGLTLMSQHQGLIFWFLDISFEKLWLWMLTGIEYIIAHHFVARAQGWVKDAHLQFLGVLSFLRKNYFKNCFILAAVVTSVLDTETHRWSGPQS